MQFATKLIAAAVEWHCSVIDYLVVNSFYRCVCMLTAPTHHCSCCCQDPVCSQVQYIAGTQGFASHCPTHRLETTTPGDKPLRASLLLRSAAPKGLGSGSRFCHLWQSKPQTLGVSGSARVMKQLRRRWCVLGDTAGTVACCWVLTRCRLGTRMPHHRCNSMKATARSVSAIKCLAPL
jgi:hypothetical protein